MARARVVEVSEAKLVSVINESQLSASEKQEFKALINSEYQRPIDEYCKGKAPDCQKKAYRGQYGEGNGALLEKYRALKKIVATRNPHADSIREQIYSIKPTTTETPAAGSTPTDGGEAADDTPKRERVRPTIITPANIAKGLEGADDATKRETWAMHNRFLEDGDSDEERKRLADISNGSVKWSDAGGIDKPKPSSSDDWRLILSVGALFPTGIRTQSWTESSNPEDFRNIGGNQGTSEPGGGFSLEAEIARRVVAGMFVHVGAYFEDLLLNPIENPAGGRDSGWGHLLAGGASLGLSYEFIPGKGVSFGPYAKLKLGARSPSGEMVLSGAGNRDFTMFDLQGCVGLGVSVALSDKWSIGARGGACFTFSGLDKALPNQDGDPDTDQRTVGVEPIPSGYLFFERRFNW